MPPVWPGMGDPDRPRNPGAAPFARVFKVPFAWRHHRIIRALPSSQLECFLVVARAIQRDRLGSLATFEAHHTPESVQANSLSAVVFREILDGRLYRDAECPSFDEYCSKGWEMDPQPARHGVDLLEDVGLGRGSV